MSNEILASSSIGIQYLASMAGKVSRGLRDWKLPFTGHHLVYPDATEEAICYTLAPFLLCVVLHHLISLTRRWIRRRKNIRKGYRRLEGCESGRRKGTRWTRWHPAIMTGLRNQMELKTLPASWMSVSNYVELAWTVVFCAIVIVPTMYLSYTPAYYGGRTQPNGNRNTWANPMGAAAFAQLPIIIALAGKNNLVSLLTGIPYQELNYLHRASGRLCLLCSWLHTIGWIDGAYGVEMTGRFGLTQDWIVWGFVGLAALTILTLSSFRLFRQMAYEAFLFTHIITTILFLVGCYFHWDWQAYWVWSGFLLWGIDRLISLARLVIVNKLWLIKSESRDECGQATIEVLDGEVMRLTMRRDLLEWKAGQHAFLSVPSIGWTKVEQHPFSYANCPVDGVPHEAVFLIKAEQGFTRQLYDAVISDKITSIPTYLDGSYGTSVDLTCYSTVLGIAGGTGITHVLSHAIHLLDLVTTDQTPLRHLHLVWNIRHASHVEWIAPLLNTHLASLPSAKHLRVTIDIHVTRENVSREPHEEPVDLPAAFEGVLSSLPAHLRRDSIFSRARPSIDQDMGGDNETRRESRPLLVSAASTFTEEQEVLYTKRGDRHGLSDHAWRLIRWKSGRAGLRGYVQDDIDESYGDMGVIVCGPSELLDDAAKVVREIGTAKAVWDGQPSIDFYRDSFGW